MFNLRRGAKFHEAVFFGNRSTEITAQDVVYSFTQLIQNANDQVFNSTIGHRIVGAAAFRKGDETQLDGITVIDDYTVRFTLNKPDKSFLYVLAQPAMGIVPKGLQENETVDLIGAGPFQLASAEGQIVLKRNPDYHLTDEFGNQYPYLDTLVFVKAERNTDRLEMFFNEEVDVIANLELDPVRSILEQHVAEFSGKSPQYIMKRETDNASFETYSIDRAGIKGLGSGFMGYRDYSRVQFEQ